MDTFSFSGILLAGGKSRRMGRDKAFLQYNEKELYKYSLEKLETLCEDILISANHHDFDQIGYPVIEDSIKDIGPIGGLYSCLPHVKHSKVLVLACDTPLVNISYLKILLQKSIHYSICMAAGPSGNPEPLIAVYDQNILPLLQNNIKNKNYKLNSLLQYPGSCSLELSEVPEKYRPEFRNINSPEDLADIDDN